jgi:glycosyltransferase A (GT-A) superfamily protein (DUF2064 family)/SAM-dependent methyltransferase
MSTLMVIAKQPLPGRVKTRLTSVYTPAQAARLARAAILDTLDAVCDAPADHRVLILDGVVGDWLPERFRDEFTVIPQVSGTLDVRLAAAFAAVAGLDPGPALLIGMDTPQVTAEVLAKGLMALGERSDADAAFGPAEDGGFWALGLREPGHPRVDGLLLGVPMSRDDTGAVQHARLVDADLRVSILPSLRDVDEAPDARNAARQAPGSRFARLLDRLVPGQDRDEDEDDAEDDPAPEARSGSMDRYAAESLAAEPLADDRADGAGKSGCVSAKGGAADEPSWSGPVSSGYERALWQSLARCSKGWSGPEAEPIILRGDDGHVFPLDVAKYAAEPDAVDHEILDRCTGPTLDIGCGPGRLAAELARRGVPSLGVDVTPVALLIARAAGAMALCRSVFDRLPGEGRWPHALLIDGNIGIGGDPTALLRRVKAILLPRGGELLVETAACELDERHELRVDGQGATVPWASVGSKALLERAEPLGYRLASSWETAGRRFAVLAT